ncbi:MAG: MBL fold metallo-hydrolase [Candidatus Margulisiibacteriota bacterium]
MQEVLDPARPATWQQLKKLPPTAQKAWLHKHFKEIREALTALDNTFLTFIGHLCVNNNLYQEAEYIFDELFKKGHKQHDQASTAAYSRGITRFLQGRFQDAYSDFKLSHQHDLQKRNFNAPATQAIAYMEDTLFPTRETIKKNQVKLLRDLNAPRAINHAIGPNILRIMRKWNSSSPLFSHGVSQGGGYFLTTKNRQGETKGIVIDPGYAFFDIFRDLGLGIADIDAIIITHDHDDHTDSVEGILSLLAKYNDHNDLKHSKVIDIFASAGTMLKFNGLLPATDPNGNREINFKLLVPGSTVTEIGGKPLIDSYGFTISVKPAHHTEFWTNQESSVGLVLNTNLPYNSSETLKLGLTGDTRYEVGLGLEYHEAQVIMLNIGSVEKEEGRLLKQHLGMLGCINLLKEARIGKPALAILTEFGEEFSGRRETISHIIENWAQAIDGSHSSGLKVIPSDVHLELRLTDLQIRETGSGIFFPYRQIRVDESDPEVLKYKFNG